MASSGRHNPAFLYGAHVHLMKGRGWVKSLSDEEREVTLGSTSSRIRGGWPACAGPGCSVQGRNYLLQLIITAIVSPCQPPVSLDPGVNRDHGGARGGRVRLGGLCTREAVFPPSITLRSNNIPYINILQTTRSHLTREGELTFYIG